MHMRTEFIFDRPTPPINIEYAQQLRDVEQAIGSIGKGDIDYGEAEEFLDQIGHVGGCALSVWSLIARDAAAGKALKLDSVLDAALFMARYSEDYTPTANNQPRDRAMAGLVMTADLTADRARSPQIKAIAAFCGEHIRCVSEANSGHVVYRDPWLMISWRSGFGKQRPELYVLVRNQRTGLWVWAPSIVTAAAGCGANFNPPLSSFRAARQAIANWKGQPLTGELVGSSAIRLCELLGIQVQGDKGVIHRSRR